MVLLFVIAVILLACGWFSFSRSRQLREETGLPQGRLVYADRHGQAWQPTVEPFYSERYGLVGKPDYLVETAKGLIPVEVKSSTAPEVPYLGHLLQLAAYCLLVEDCKGQTPEHGLLSYSDALYEVDFTPELRTELLETLADMRQARVEENVPRSHNQPGKCSACGFLATCKEALHR